MSAPDPTTANPWTATPDPLNRWAKLASQLVTTAAEDTSSRRFRPGGAGAAELLARYRHELTAELAEDLAAAHAGTYRLIVAAFQQASHAHRLGGQS